MQRALVTAHQHREGVAIARLRAAHPLRVRTLGFLHGSPCHSNERHAHLFHDRTLRIGVIRPVQAPGHGRDAFGRRVCAVEPALVVMRRLLAVTSLHFLSGGMAVDRRGRRFP